MPFSTPEGTQFVRLLGGGSVFQVSLVRMRDRDLVCKRLAPHALDTHEGRAAMVREARLVSLVSHPALPQLVRVGTDAHGPFFLETFLPGTSLRELRRGWSVRDKRPPNTLVRHIIFAALEALAEVHELTDDKGSLGVVHGDITPDHVLFGPLGDVLFVDLGAARFRDLDPQVDTEDRGTVPYVAPEVVRGDVKPGQTSDTYALCATLLWFATGEELCVSATDAAKLAEVATNGVRLELVEKMSALSSGERVHFRQALDADPTSRLGSARRILQLLEAPDPPQDITNEAR